MVLYFNAGGTYFGSEGHWGRLSVMVICVLLCPPLSHLDFNQSFLPDRLLFSAALVFQQIIFLYSFRPLSGFGSKLAA